MAGLVQFASSPRTANALAKVHPGLGFAPAVIGLVGSILGIGAQVAAPLLGPSRGTSALEAERAALERAWAERAAEERRQRLMIGGGVLLAGAGLTYYLVRRKKRSR